MKVEKWYGIQGLHCSACANNIEKKLKDYDFIDNVSVYTVTSQMKVTYNQDVDESWIKVLEEMKFHILPLDIREVVLIIKNMHCSACVNTITEYLLKQVGIVKADGDVLQKKIIIHYDETKITVQKIASLLKGIGYENERCIENIKNETTHKKNSLWFTLILGLLLLYIGMSHMVQLPLPTILSYHTNATLFISVQWLLATLILILNRHIFVSAYQSIRHNMLNMDTLIGIGSGTAYAYSTLAIYFLRNDLHELMNHLYFESAGIILVSIVFGKYLEERAKKQTTKALEEFHALQVRYANVIKDNEVVRMHIEEIQVHDQLIVKAGERIPLDGIIRQGRASIDEQWMNGESLPRIHQVNDEVMGGTMNLDGSLQIEVMKRWNEGHLANIIRLVEETQSKKAPIAKLADKICAVFVPIVILIAILSAGIWFFITKDFSFTLLIFVSVIVIACPCGLGLATPTAIMVGTLVAAKKQMFIKSGESFQQLSELKAIVFDKTGTLTKGKPTVTRILSDEAEADVIRIAAMLEEGSTHPFAHAILEKARELNIANIQKSNVITYAGYGLETTINQDTYRIGNLEFMEQYNISCKQYELESKLHYERGNSVLWLSKNQQLLGIIVCEDELKMDSKDVIDYCKRQGIHVTMLSGDHEIVANKIAERLNITNVIAEVKPDEKAQNILQLQKKYGKVAMVGDGINDAVAMIQSDVAIAIGSGSNIAIDSADIVLMEDQLSTIVSAHELSKKVFRIVKQNLFWAFFYNCTMIPFAAGIFYPSLHVLMQPSLAAFAMSFSSITVVLNALRLYRYQ